MVAQNFRALALTNRFAARPLDLGWRVHTRALLGLFAICFLCFAGTPAEARRYAAIVVDADTGRVLFSRNADRRVYPASLTKMMTLYMLFEALEERRLHLGSRLKVSRRAAGQPASRLGLKAKSTISVEQAIFALVTKSANDVATVVSENLARSEVAFARKMTAKARQLGMSRTSFRNASGLPNRRQLSTARDMAKLSAALKTDFPQYYHYFKTKTWRYSGRRHRNHNRLLGRYPGVDGLKTGYIRASGFNLAASAERNGRRLIGIVFGGKTALSRDRHMISILDRSFARAGPGKRSKSRPTGRPIPSHKPNLKRFAPVVPAPAHKPGSLMVLRQDADQETAGSWLIQVGAFHQFASAQLRAEMAADLLAPTYRDSEATIQSLHNGSRNLYRARLLGFKHEAEAQAACKLLSRRDIGCVALPSRTGKQS